MKVERLNKVGQCVLLCVGVYWSQTSRSGGGLMMDVLSTSPLAAWASGPSREMSSNNILQALFNAKNIK